MTSASHNPRIYTRLSSQPPAALQPIQSYHDLSLSDIRKLVEVLSHAPHPRVHQQSPIHASYIKFTQKQITTLPVYLRCHRTSSLSFRTRKLRNAEADVHQLCGHHALLSPRLVGKIFEFVRREIEERIPAFLSQIRAAELLSPELDQIFDVLVAMPTMWSYQRQVFSEIERSCQPSDEFATKDPGVTKGYSNGRNHPTRSSGVHPFSTASLIPNPSILPISHTSTATTLCNQSASPYYQSNTCQKPVSKWTRQLNSCPACILARIGSDMGALSALHIAMLAKWRTERIVNGRSKRFAFVEAWIANLCEEEEHKWRLLKRNWELGLGLKRLTKRARSLKRKEEALAQMKGKVEMREGADLEEIISLYEDTGFGDLGGDAPREKGKTEVPETSNSEYPQSSGGNGSTIIEDGRSPLSSRYSTQHQTEVHQQNASSLHGKLPQRQRCQRQEWVRPTSYLTIQIPPSYSKAPQMHMHPVLRANRFGVPTIQERRRQGRDTEDFAEEYRQVLDSPYWSC